MGVLKITQETCRFTPLTFNACMHAALFKVNGHNMSNSADRWFYKLAASHKHKHNGKKKKKNSIRGGVTDSKVIPDLFDRALNSSSFQPTSARVAMFLLRSVLWFLKEYPFMPINLKW